MVKVRTQNVPSEDAFAYSGSLRLAVDHPGIGRKYGTFKYAQAKYGSTLKAVQRRYPFKQPFKKNISKHSPTTAQRATREIFSRATRCFAAQPISGGATPPALGPRNRGYWYTSSIPSGLFYYDYFMGETLCEWFGEPPPARYPFNPTVPDWCHAPPTDDTYADRVSPSVVKGGSISLLITAGYILGIFSESQRVYIKYNNVRLNFAKIYGTVDFADPGASPVYLEAWTVTNVWSESTLTWNNKPTLGAKIGQVQVFDAPVTPTWIEIDFESTNPNGVCLKFSDGIPTAVQILAKSVESGSNIPDVIIG